MASKKMKRTFLSLEQKVGVIRFAENNPGVGARAVAEANGIGKTQACDILRNKESILAEYDSNPSPSKLKRCRVSKFTEVNDTLYEWYIVARSKNIHPSGPQLATKAKEIAARLGKPEFEGSNGWLSKWKARYNVKRESADPASTAPSTVASRKETLPEILGGYAKENIFNFNETGLLWRALPNAEFGQTMEQCKTGEKSQHRFTVAFLANAAGDKETPVVVWTTDQPKCFRGLDRSHLPVKYCHQSKAWMSAGILHSYLTAFNLKMREQKRSVVVLLSNSGSHLPGVVQGHYSNIKIVFLPVTAKKLQPLNLGVISMFKARYRRLLLQYVSVKMDSSMPASEVIKSVSVLMALQWVAQAWGEVKSTTIQRCFRNAGCVSASVTGNVTVSYRSKETDTVIAEIPSLISRVMGSLEHCSAVEYINGDSSLPVCFDISNDRWEEQFLLSLSDDTELIVVDDSQSEEDLDIPPPVPTIKSYLEAAKSLEEVKVFLEGQGCFEEASAVSSVLTHVVKGHSSSLA